jgi:diacylglycerol kinase (ATP)
MEPTEKPPRHKSFFVRRLHSFRYAFWGLFYILRMEVNMRIHAVATVLVIAAGVWRGLSVERWSLVMLAIGAVWTAEAMNTAIERLSDLYTGGKYHTLVKQIKDIAAGAVVVAALVSVVVGVLVFFF